MLATPALWSPLLLLLGALAAPQGKAASQGKAAGQGKAAAHAKAAPQEEAPPEERKPWDPTFDYTNLQPSNDEYWAPLAKAPVTLEQAIQVATEAEGMPIRVMKAELRPGETPVWYLQIFGIGDPDHPKRANVQVSATEPKVLKRLGLLTLPADEQRIWESLRTAELPPEVAIMLSIEKVRGAKEEASIDQGRARTLEFLAEGTPVWRCEIMGLDTKKELVRRYEVEVSTSEPKVRRKLMLDRFSGEPLRRGEPTQLEDGVFLHDLTVGDGEVVAADSKVRVNYRLFLLDGSKLHDTWKSKLEETFLVSQAPLKGMTEGMVGMRVGGKRKIAIPYPLAFGEQGNEIAPPRAMVVCDVQVEGLSE